MDTFSHGLWATAAAKAANKTGQKRLRVGWMAFWGVLPDLFSFTPAIIWILWQMVIQGTSFADIPRLERLPLEVRDSFLIFRLTNTLYHISHSIVIFAAVFLVAWGFRRLRYRYRQQVPTTVQGTPYWEMAGWLIHIVMDIPTHAKEFYPTPFLWPLLDLKLYGISWATPWVMVLNYSTLVGLFVALRLMGNHKGQGFKWPSALKKFIVYGL